MSHQLASRQRFTMVNSKSESNGPIVLAVQNSKGGSTKSTVSIYLSIAFSLQGLRVLMIDLDEQGHLTKFMLAHRSESANETDPGVENVWPVLMGDRELRDVTIQTHYGDLLASTPKMQKLRTEIADDLSISTRLADALRGAASWDVAVIDTPGRIGLEMEIATIAANAVIYAFPPSDSGLESLDYVKALIRRSGNGKRLAGFPVAFGGSRNDQDLLAEVPGLDFDTILPVVPFDGNVKIRAENLRAPLRKGSKAYESFKAAATEIASWR